MVFFLNGYGPRHIGIVPRESHISFVINGGIPEGTDYVTSVPLRVVVAIENNLDPKRPDIQRFLKRFPGIDWNIVEAPESLYPMILTGKLLPANN